MSALQYLLFTRLRNSLREFIRKPVRLVVLLVCVALIGFTIFAGNQASLEEGHTYRSATELYLIIAGVCVFMFASIMWNGVRKGATFFTMPDVLLLFPSPLNPKGVMFYGMIRSIGMYLAISLFYLMQYSTVHGVYGKGFPTLIVAMLLFVASTFLANFLSFQIYRKKIGGTREDYYEAVLSATEVSHSAVVAQKEGRTAEIIPQNIKLGSTGFTKGRGASAFYYKHKIENRRGRKLFLNMWSLMAIIGSLAFAFVITRVGEPPEDLRSVLVGVFTFATYLQLFSVAMGRLSFELTKPYVYLVPEEPFFKLLHCLREMIPTSVIDAVAVGAGLGIILGLDPLMTLLLVIARLSFAMVFTAANIAVARIWGGETSKVIVMLLYLAVIIVMLIPAVAAAIIFSTIIKLSFLTAGQTIMFFLAVLNIPVSLAVFYLCRKMLDHAELNNS
ncbi:MAG: putative ABC exporter domain-containing protein [Oscillospiraceae bacterium]|jgi:hypothetical protein|nr:putative ABC exporter domain-containing protein [Oscillospiraceae bacterium]